MLGRRNEARHSAPAPAGLAGAGAAGSVPPGPTPKLNGCRRPARPWRSLGGKPGGPGRWQPGKTLAAGRGGSGPGLYLVRGGPPWLNWPAAASHAAARQCAAEAAFAAARPRHLDAANRPGAGILRPARTGRGAMPFANARARAGVGGKRLVLRGDRHFECRRAISKACRAAQQ